MGFLLLAILTMPPERLAERPPVTWDPLSWSAEGLALGGRTPTAGIGGSVSRPLGVPRERLSNLASGWVVRPGIDATAVRLFGPACEPVESNCDVLPFAFRLAVGPSFTVGFAEGEIDREGVARASLLVSFGISAFAAFHRIDAGPLAPSTAFWDVVVRGRVGVMHPGHVFSLAIIAESALRTPLVRGLNLGFAVGVAY